MNNSHIKKLSHYILNEGQSDYIIIDPATNRIKSTSTINWQGNTEDPEFSKRELERKYPGMKYIKYDLFQDHSWRIGDVYGEKEVKKPVTEKEKVLDRLTKFAAKIWNVDPNVLDGQVLDYEESTPSGIPVYAAHYDLKVVYAGVLLDGRTLPLVVTESDGQGSEETVNKWNGGVYRVNFDSGNNILFRGMTPQLIKITGTLYDLGSLGSYDPPDDPRMPLDENTESNVILIAEDPEPNNLLFLMLDILWGFTNENDLIKPKHPTIAAPKKHMHEEIFMHNIPTLEHLLEEMSNDYSINEGSDEIPEIGDVVRTKKMQMEGKVEKVGENRAGYTEVFFRTQDGRLMKTPADNAIVITKLADCDSQVMESIFTEVSQKYHAKKSKTNEARFGYDKKTGDMKKDDSDPDQRHGLYLDGKLSKTCNTKEEANNVKKRDPKYKNATIKKIAEGMMGGLNRVPNLGLKYDKVLDEVQQRWKQEQMEAIDPWHGYTPDDPKAGALAKAPKNAVRGTPGYPLGEMIKDNIRAHGLKWAFQYHVIKHGLPPRHFQLLAGLMPKRISTPAPLG